MTTSTATNTMLDTLGRLRIVPVLTSRIRIRPKRQRTGSQPAASPASKSPPDVGRTGSDQAPRRWVWPARRRRHRPLTEQASAAADAGAQFAVAPRLNEAVLSACRKACLPVFPGVATPTEIERARSLGLNALKLFPARQLGRSDYLRAVSATYPDVRFIPTGGITATTLADYLTLPNVLACAGSWIAHPELGKAIGLVP